MEKVLIIDDCEEFREVVAELLIEAGYEVCEAGNPEEARQHCNENQFDLILCDLVMPMESELDHDEECDSAMVGVHAIHEFSKKYPNTPIIAISGQMEGTPLKAMESFGAVDSLSKPFGRDELLKVVNNALRK